MTPRRSYWVREKTATSKVYIMYVSIYAIFLIWRANSWCKGLRNNYGETVPCLDCCGGHANLHTWQNYIKLNTHTVACKSGDLWIRLMDQINLDFLIGILYIYKILSWRERYTEISLHFLHFFVDMNLLLSHNCFCSATKSYPTPCDPMSCSMPGSPVPLYPPGFAQTHVESAMPSSHLILYCYLIIKVFNI